MIPRISPGKTWEGFGGAVVVSTAASVIFARLAGAHLAGMTLMHSIILGIILSLSAVVGDLRKIPAPCSPASAASWIYWTACCSTLRSCICICGTF
jgi:hypothetical protein